VAYSWERIPYARSLVKEKLGFSVKEGDEFSPLWLRTGYRGEYHGNEQGRLE
jgi:hypothetical protein